MLPHLRTAVRRTRPPLHLFPYTVRRQAHFPSFSGAKSGSLRILPKVGLFSVGILGGAYYLRTSIHADAESASPHSPPSPQSLPSLLRSYTVYTLCSIPLIVDNAPSILSFLISIPGISILTERLVRSTFFAQFVGGDSAEDTVPLLEQMRREGKGGLLAYSVEVDEEEGMGVGKVAEKAVVEELGVGVEEVWRQNVEETIRCIDVAGSFEDRIGGEKGRKTWVAIKLTALLPSAQSLIALSQHLTHSRPSSPSIHFPGYPHPSDLSFIESESSIIPASIPSTLTKEDIKSLKTLYNDLTRIAERAQEKGVKIIVDAEYSWYQPAIDAFTLSLMRRFNAIPKRPSESKTVQPLIYATYQAYLKWTPSHIHHSLLDAHRHSYSLGIKLVRGAYHHFEVQADPSPDTCPVWLSKAETDKCYDECVGVIIGALKRDIEEAKGEGKGLGAWWNWLGLGNGEGVKVPRIGVLFGTHNEKSCQVILDGLLREGIAYRREEDGKVVASEEGAERCVIGQLFGMSDALTDKLVAQVESPSPFIIKYIPYGPLLAVMPYLGRRAIENKSILSGESGAAAERRRAGKEIRRRLFGFLFG